MPRMDARQDLTFPWQIKESEKPRQDAIPWSSPMLSGPSPYLGKSTSMAERKPHGQLTGTLWLCQNSY
jgi:hypothetical protein